MMKQLFALFLLLMTVEAWAQAPTVISISKPGPRPAYCGCPDFVLDNYRVFFPDSIEKSHNQIEIRLFEPGTSQIRLTRITYKDQKWRAAYYLKRQVASLNFDRDFPNGIFKHQFHKFNVKGVKVDSVFFELVLANAFGKNHSDGTGRGPMRLEYIINGRSGTYFLDGPQAKSISVQENSQNLAILDLFNRLTKGQGPDVINDEQ